ncbi:hypothetical protein DL768_003121 [Monosporascus sp. mg162]|nr:hypothetical protein DL768_003121 [Monosporascus sp. mg162]
MKLLTTYGWTQSVGTSRYEGEDSPVRSLLLQSHLVRQNDSDDDRKPGATEPLNATPYQQHRKGRRRGSRTQRAPNNHNNEHGLYRGMATEDIRYLSPERYERGIG